MADIKFSQFTAGGNVQVGDKVVGLRNGDNAQFTFPGTGISDASGNIILGYTSPGAAAINYVSIENAITNTVPSISSKGSDLNVDLQISSKGTSSVFVNTVGFDDAGGIAPVTKITFVGSSSGSVILEAQAAAGTPTLQFPTSSGILTTTAMASGIVNNGMQNQLAYYSATGTTVSGLSSASSAVLSTNSIGGPVWLNLEDGEIAIGSTSGEPAAATLTAGSGISITNGSNSITIDCTIGGGGLTWGTITGTTQLATVNSGWIPTDVALTTITLPSTAPIGSVVSVQGQGSGGWTIQAPGAQIINVGSTPTSAGGTVSSANRYDAITLVCIVADTEWGMYGPVSSGFVTT